MNLYIDIDGTLVSPYGPAECLREFLEYATEHFECFWLTTHCLDGDPSQIFSRLRSAGVPDDVMVYAERITPTSWRAQKTDAIDLSSEFIWLDDAPFPSDLAVLARAGKTGALWQINLEENPSALCRALERLRAFSVQEEKIPEEKY